MSLASLLDSSSDAYVRESFPSGVCEIDSLIGKQNFIQFFLFTPSRWTKGSFWSLSFLASFPAEKQGWAQPLKLINGKPS